MRHAQIIWDDSSSGNTEHVAENGITNNKVEEVLRDRKSTRAISRRSGKSIVFGFTTTGKYIAVVFEDLGGDSRLIPPITAYETEP